MADEVAKKLAAQLDNKRRGGKTGDRVELTFEQLMAKKRNPATTEPATPGPVVPASSPVSEVLPPIYPASRKEIREWALPDMSYIDEELSKLGVKGLSEYRVLQEGGTDEEPWQVVAGPEGRDYFVPGYGEAAGELIQLGPETDIAEIQDMLAAMDKMRPPQPAR